MTVEATCEIEGCGCDSVLFTEYPRRWACLVKGGKLYPITEPITPELLLASEFVIVREEKR